MVDNESERDLIDAIRRGDQAAWQTCINLYEGRLIAFANSRLRNRAAAEDVVQEAFMGFLTSLPNYNEETPLERFLFSITAYKLTDALRKKGRRPTVSLDSSGREGESSFGSGHLAASARAASSLFRSQERQTREELVLGGALGELIQQWKEERSYERLMCVELLFVRGQSNKSVANALGITEQDVANHKHFTVTKLKDAARKAGLKNSNSLPQSLQS